MPKLDIRDANPLFRLNGDDVRDIAAETIRRHQPVEATDKAVAWARTLWTQKQIELLPLELRPVVQRMSTGKVTARDCSRLIEALKTLPYRQQTQNNIPTAQVGDGFYKLGSDYVKVQEARNGSGRLYAKRWDGSCWEYESGLVRKLSPEMALTQEQAKEWGDLYGCCIFCSRDLTDERSINAGYGPTCADKRGLPWG